MVLSRAWFEYIKNAHVPEHQLSAYDVEKDAVNDYYKNSARARNLVIKQLLDSEKEGRGKSFKEVFWSFSFEKIPEILGGSFGKNIMSFVISPILKIF